ncbi:hypothetical protein HUG10_20525 (plasmid) [Halorarum halophilum]|uniref:TOTE conflict system primase domain-containing protein n=1 Tax=Halorarum halophilum TaxID=2743090 RepID=A0A7D5KAM1_9EURY|nr:hypothetical protein [Halobaculum halophilum]QLG29994.1 hypothetical protein HUG10_20525 [Halobaculum halophilum]
MSTVNHDELGVSVPLYLDLFKTRDDCFAVQRMDGSYGPLNIEFEEKHVEQHINGERTYGQYLVDPVDNTVRFAAIDNDIDDDSNAPLENALEAAVLEKQRALEFGLRDNQVWLEFSGRRGYHTWFFFDPPVKATLAKQLLEYIVGGTPEERDAYTEQINDGADPDDLDTPGVDIPGGHTEVFPKQVGLSTGEYGNLIKTPFGLHQKTGNRMLFVDETGEPYSDQASIIRAAIRNRIHPDVAGGILEEFGDDTEHLVEEAEQRAAGRGRDLEDIVSEGMDIRPCIEAAITGQKGNLSGEEGHHMRLAAAAELLANGYSVEEAHEFFKAFPNYDPKITEEKLREVQSNLPRPWACSTIKDKCGSLVTDCPCPATSDIDLVTSMELNHQRYGHVWKNDE